MEHGALPSNSIQNFIVVRMRSDPEPYNNITLPLTQRAPIVSNPHGVNWLDGIDPLKFEAGMMWIIHPKTVVLSRKILNLLG